MVTNSHGQATKKGEEDLLRVLCVRLPSESSVGEADEGAYGQKTTQDAIHGRVKTARGVATEGMDVKLLQEVHSKRIDLRQQSKDKN